MSDAERLRATLSSLESDLNDLDDALLVAAKALKAAGLAAATEESEQYCRGAGHGYKQASDTLKALLRAHYERKAAPL